MRRKLHCDEAREDVDVRCQWGNESVPFVPRPPQLYCVFKSGQKGASCGQTWRVWVDVQERQVKGYIRPTSLCFSMVERYANKGDREEPERRTRLLNGHIATLAQLYFIPLLPRTNHDTTELSLCLHYCSSGLVSYQVDAYVDADGDVAHHYRGRLTTRALWNSTLGAVVVESR